MSWDAVILERCQAGDSLGAAVDRLFDCQRQQWDMFAQGESDLSTIRTKTLHHEGASITVQVNPARRRSTHAKTDTKSIAQRSCFLCPENMPPEEQGIGLGDLVILPNPFPVLPKHCTIPAQDHSPQQIESRVATLLQLAREIGPELFVFYNGPRCGASAPDHFHFQACLADPVPLLKTIATVAGATGVQGQESFGRRYVVLVDSDSAALQVKIERCLAALREITHSDAEPMMNLLVHAQGDTLVAIVFPRAAHRPACFFEEGPEQIAVSPATLEMAGVLVVPEPDHFNKITATEALHIYRDVSFGSQRFSQLMDRLQ